MIIGEIIGHRYWIAVAKYDGRLFGPHSGHDWRPDEATATHIMLREHTGVYAYSFKTERAGVYAFKTKEKLYAHFDGPELTDALRKLWWDNPQFSREEAIGVVLGTVRLFGTVQPHEHGYRGEFGRVNSLDEIILGPEFMMRTNDGGFLYRLRIKYGVMGGSNHGT